MYGNLYSQNNMSQVDTVLQHLVAFGKISPEIASDWYGIKYLPKCISRLRKRKINIKKQMGDTEKRFDFVVENYVLCKDQPKEVKKMLDTLKINNLKKSA